MRSRNPSARGEQTQAEQNTASVFITDHISSLGMPGKAALGHTVRVSFIFVVVFCFSSLALLCFLLSSHRHTGHLPILYSQRKTTQSCSRPPHLEQRWFWSCLAQCSSWSVVFRDPPHGGKQRQTLSAPSLHRPTSIQCWWFGEAFWAACHKRNRSVGLWKTEAKKASPIPSLPPPLPQKASSCEHATRVDDILDVIPFLYKS